MSPTTDIPMDIKLFFGFHYPVCSCPNVYSFLFIVTTAKTESFIICNIK